MAKVPPIETRNLSTKGTASVSKAWSFVCKMGRAHYGNTVYRVSSRGYKIWKTFTKEWRTKVCLILFKLCISFLLFLILLYLCLRFHLLFGLLICTLISENIGLEKSRSISNPRKISGSVNLDFFPGFQLEKKLGLCYKSEKIQLPNLKKTSGLQNLKFFLGFEIDLDFSRPWFSEIRVQIKRLIEKFVLENLVNSTSTGIQLIMDDIVKWYRGC